MTATSAVQRVVRDLRAMGSEQVRSGMLRYGIVEPKAFGIPMAKIQAYSKRLGRDHARAQALWATGWYEARMVAIYTADPAALTVKEMEAWRRDFDSWAMCDTACWVLYDKSPLAWKRIGPWSKATGEFQKRAAFALLAGLALHDKLAADEAFVPFLPLIAKAADDERNFVKKGVNWALRSIGIRSPVLYASCVHLANELAAREEVSARWIGKDALRYFATAAAKKRVASNAQRRLKLRQAK